MGCNCKNEIRIMEKYDENYQEEQEENNIFIHIVNFILRSFFGIIAGFFVIIAIVPLIIYVVVCLLIGVEPKIRIWDFNKRLINKKK